MLSNVMTATEKYVIMYQEFIEALYHESPRAAWEFESFRYGIMARLGLSELDALELAVKIVAGPLDKQAKQN